MVSDRSGDGQNHGGVLGARQQPQHLVQMAREQVGRHSFLAAKLNMATHRHRPPTTTELPVVRQEDGSSFVGPHGELVIIGIAKTDGIR